MEIGGQNARAGWAGTQAPQHVFSPWQQQQRQAAIKPVEAGVVKNWDAFEAALRLGLSKTAATTADTAKDAGDAGDTGDAAPLLLVDSPSMPEQDREKACEIALEKIGCPSFFVLNDMVASVYSAGRVSSYVFDIGYDTCHAGVVHEGFLFPHTFTPISVGGAHITQCLRELFNERGLNLDAHTAEQVKLSHARTALDFAREAAELWSLPAEDTVSITAPDGHHLPLADTGIRAAEALFQPMLAGRPGLGLSDALVDITNSCAQDRDFPPLQNMPLFYLATGGASQMPGIGERVYNDLMAGILSTSLSKQVFVSALQKAPDRHHAAWIGGSIVASLPRFIDKNFVTKAEFDEHGASIVHKRC